MSATKGKPADKVEAILDGTADAVAPWERTDGGQEDVSAPERPVNEIEPGEDSALATVPDSFIEDTSVSLGGRTYSEDLDFTAEELRIPRLRVISGQSAEVRERTGQIGQWIVSGNPALDSVTFAVLGVSRFREKRNKDSNAIECKSDDGRIGQGDHGQGSEAHPSGVCVNCPLSKWGDRDASGKGKPPVCSDGFSYQVWVKEYNTVAVLDLKKTGMDLATKVNAQLRMRRARGFMIETSHTMERSPVGGGSYPKAAGEPRAITREERQNLEACLSGAS
jgi:hypothetical protein